MADWIGLLGALVCEAKDDEHGKTERERRIDAAHRALFDCLQRRLAVGESDSLRSREADRQRFGDPLFNTWLDETVADGGWTAWHLLSSTGDAKAGWDCRASYDPAFMEMLPCGHAQSSKLHSAETGAPLYCEACDDKSDRRDAEAMEQHWQQRALAAESDLAGRQGKQSAHLSICSSQDDTMPGHPECDCGAHLPAPLLGQFLSDVLTAAGLIEHGRQSKALAERLSRGCMSLRALLATCNNAVCGWSGFLSECCYLRGIDGGVGPLCPRCRETVEVDAPLPKGIDQ